MAETRRLHHFRWDLDKTYIRTDFDTRRDLFRTWLQKAEEKRGIPGAATLLRALLRADVGEERRVTFISGSPRQMRSVLERKLQLDGITPDQFILKPNLSNLLLFRFKAMHSQVGYKLEALLTSRLPSASVEESLFGDDAEQDALVYCLYADLMAGSIDRSTLEEILRAADTDPRESARILSLVEALPMDPRQVQVGRIFINLERRSPLARFDAFAGRVSPIYNYFQAAVLLHADGTLPAHSLRQVVLDLGDEGYTARRLLHSVRDLLRRGLLDASALPTVQRGLRDERSAALLDAVLDGWDALADTRCRAEGMDQPVDWMRACSDLRRYRREASKYPLLSILE
jgi:hypothetical protein